MSRSLLCSPICPSSALLADARLPPWWESHHSTATVARCLRRVATSVRHVEHLALGATDPDRACPKSHQRFPEVVTTSLLQPGFWRAVNFEIRNCLATPNLRPASLTRRHGREHQNGSKTVGDIPIPGQVLSRGSEHSHWPAADISDFCNPPRTKQVLN